MICTSIGKSGKKAESVYLAKRTIVGLGLILFGLAVVLAGEMAQGAEVAAAGDRGQVLFDEGWLFIKQDVKGAEAAGFDDSSWRKVELPHDWSIEGPFDGKWASSTGFLPGGIGWYRKHFAFSPAAGQAVTIRFDGVYRDSTVYLNGKKLGERPYGFSSFEYDLTPGLIAGDNVLAVRVDRHEFADLRWYPGSGIYRNVYLTQMDAVHVDRYGVCITTPVVGADRASVQADTLVRNDSTEAATALVRTRILDANGVEVANVSSERQALQPGSSVRFRKSADIANPSLWSVDHPGIYTAITEVVESDKTVDAYSTPFGIRSIKFDPNSGFFLNGESLKIKGVCVHEDAGALGSAIPRQVWERRLRILKEAGVNAIRTAHNPPAPEFLDLCDRMGFLVMDEAFDEWSAGKKKWIDQRNGRKFDRDGYNESFAQWSDRDLSDMILRDRNHPSIVLWSIGNEIDYPNDPYAPNSQTPAPIAKRLAADVKALDTSRPVTAACAAIKSNLYYPELDVVGYNYQETRYPADHKKFPNMVIYGSENAQSLTAWLAVKNNPYISGQFLWTGIDYLGEAGAWPNHASAAGMLDMAGYPKAFYYFRQSLWVDKPMVRIEPGRRGLACYTNCDSVEFFQGGKSLGTRQPSAVSGMIIVPAADYALPMEAVGSMKGKAAAKDEYSVGGAAAKIALSEFKTTLGPGDGSNVAQIEVEITDSAGNRSRLAENDVAIQIDGPGRLLGIESGDINSMENPQGSHRRAYRGRLIAYVETHGRVNVSARGDGLRAAAISVGE